MFETNKIIRIKGTATRLFSILQKVEQWPVWDVDLQPGSVKLNQPVPVGTIEGTSGSLTMKNGNTFPFLIRNVVVDRQVEYLVKLPGAESDWYWKFEPVKDSPGEIDLDMGVRITGSAGFVWKLVFAPFLPKAFDICTRNLKTIIEDGKVDGVAVDL
ncbi:hypothetical protein HDU81_009849 [Chytriomyces hyalinus]|nr:hypothetical protein HDU81_009849 [Chytriomyces hyalinus]KAJ3251319.1 hypothetical protein HDU77_005980 [Chytriomyces hyalinus]